MVKQVTTIPAKINLYNQEAIAIFQKRKVAGYARVSTDSEEQLTSYEAQVDYYTNYIKSRDDWEFVSVYTDEGISATSTKNRVGFNQMVEDALDGKIDLIVTKSVSRFARNTVDSLSTIRKLKEHGTEVYFEKESIWTFDSKGELLITIMSSLAQEESRSISENCTWGQRKSLADGKVRIPFGRFLGYDRGEDGNLVVNIEQAKLVKRIFAMYLQGNSMHGIGKTLTAESIPTPGGKTDWSISTIKSILSNEKYIGDALLQKSFTVDYLTKKKKKNEGEIPQYYVENNHEAIIPRETFQRVQQLLAESQNGPKRNSSVSVLSGRIKCQSCGGWYGSKVWHSTSKYRKVIWQCNHKFKGKEKCQTRHLSESEVEEGFIKAFNQILAKRTSIIEKLTKVLEEVFDLSQLETRKRELVIELSVVTDLINNHIQENTKVIQNQVEYQVKYDEFTKRYEETSSELNQVEKSISDKLVRKGKIEDFLKTLNRNELLTNFDKDLWNITIQHVDVQESGALIYYFNSGTSITINER